MAMVTFDDRSYSLDGNRLWLVSGAVHYFRVPEALWADRLLKARRGGLNCVSTPIAWNVHEKHEGRWDFSGPGDIARFVKLAGELGLYVILKPGPYIASDWDGGGLPAWLASKSGMSLRANNAAFTHYFDKYLLQALARLSDLQVTRGGNIILIQNECEYLPTTAPDRLAYLEFINQLFRRGGFDIPVIASNLFSDPPVPQTVECASGRRHVVQRLKQLRLRQPKAPLMVSPFWCGEPDFWGGPRRRTDDAQTARVALEALGCGAQVDYTPWHGGTNFGFGGARTSRGEASFVATSYDCGAPVAEGGGLTRKYYLSRLVNTLADTLGFSFASCSADAPGVSVHGQPQVFNLGGARGRWAVVTSGGREDVSTVRVSTPTGRELDVSLQPIGASAVPVDVQLSPTIRLDWSNLMPFGFFGGKVLVLHGPPGHAGCLSINGEVVSAEVPRDDEPKVVAAQGLHVAIVNSELAMRTWHAGGAVVFGPEFVGKTVDEAVAHPHSKGFTVISLEDGTVSRRDAVARAARPAHPKLGPWKRAGVCAEPTDKELAWEKIGRPQDPDRLGAPDGYIWYRAAVQEEKALRRTLFLPACEDRAAVYLNGAPLGVWGRGPGASRAPMPAAFRRGANELTILVDNLGRFSDEPNLGQPKGLFGDIYDAQPMPLSAGKAKPFGDFSRRMVPRGFAHLAEELEAGPVWAIDLPLPMAKVAPVHLSFANVPNHLAVLCNDRQAKFFPRHWSGENFGDVTLGNELKKGRNLLRLLVWGPEPQGVLKKFSLHLLADNVSQSADWSFRLWSPPSPGARVVGKDMPAWYVAHFKSAGAEEPLFLHIIGAKKGQVYLNGHNVGRFWTVGPQEDYYLPSCWLKEENELLVFEEQGLIPAGSSLELRG
jgi:hypothetical protein